MLPILTHLPSHQISTHAKEPSPHTPFCSTVHLCPTIIAALPLKSYPNQHTNDRVPPYLAKPLIALWASLNLVSTKYLLKMCLLMVSTICARFCWQLPLHSFQVCIFINNDFGYCKYRSLVTENLSPLLSMPDQAKAP